MAELTEACDIMEKTVLFDLYRIFVLSSKPAELIFKDGWDRLIDGCIMGVLSTLDLKDEEAK